MGLPQGDLSQPSDLCLQRSDHLAARRIGLAECPIQIQPSKGSSSDAVASPFANGPQCVQGLIFDRHDRRRRQKFISDLSVHTRYHPLGAGKCSAARFFPTV